MGGWVVVVVVGGGARCSLGAELVMRRLRLGKQKDVIQLQYNAFLAPTLVA